MTTDNAQHQDEFDYEPLLVGTMRRHPTWHVQVIDAFLTGQRSGTTARTFVAEFEEAIRHAKAEGVRAAQRVLAGEDTLEWARRATTSTVSLAYAMEGLDSLIEDVLDRDDEEFCPRCYAGMESPEHHEKCVVSSPEVQS